MEKKNLLEDKFMTSAKFSQEVEKIAVTNEDMNYIDSVLHLCEINEIEVEWKSRRKPLPRLDFFPEKVRSQNCH